MKHPKKSELMEYPENTVGSLMTTDYISLNQNITVNETINELRKLKPEADSIYYLYIVDEKETLIGIVSLRDLIISQPETPLNKIMNTEVIHVYDHDKIDSLVQIITKYNLFAIPVADKEEKLTGMVIIDDVVHNLLKSRRRV